MLKKLPKKRLKKIARVHAFFSVTLFLSYIALSSIYSPEFLLSDVRKKYSAIADSIISVAAKVLEPPIKPILSGATKCDNGALSNSIVWPTDENSETFNVMRNGLPLVTGLTNNNYIDNAISIDTSYIYQVTAIGQMGPGFATSDAISITSPAKCKIIPPKPTISTILLSAQKINNQRIKINSKRPTFSGTSNLPYATINIEVHSSFVIFSQTTTNANGYWIWTAPTDITDGFHTFSATIQNPDDSTLTASSVLAFEIETNNNEDTKNNKDKVTSTPPTPTSQTSTTKNNPETNNDQIQATEATQGVPVDPVLTLENDSIYQDKHLTASIKIHNLKQEFFSEKTRINYRILNEKSEQLLVSSDEVNLSSDEIIPKIIPIPKSLAPGEYKLQVEFVNEKFSVSKEIKFSLKASDIMNFGGMVVATYPDVLSKLGSISFVTIIMLLFWILFFSHEYWLYLHAFNNVTERHLAKIGMFGARKRKGVHQ